MERTVAAGDRFLRSKASSDEPGAGRHIIAAVLPGGEMYWLVYDGKTDRLVMATRNHAAARRAMAGEHVDSDA